MLRRDGVEGITLFHDSHQLRYRSPFGAVSTGTTITLQLDVEGVIDDDNIYLIYHIDSDDVQKIKMDLTNITLDKREYTAHIQAPSLPTLMWYHFYVEYGNGNQVYYGNNQDLLGGKGVMTEQKPANYQVTVYGRRALPPSWFEGKVVYQIFVDRFFNGCDDGKVFYPKRNSVIHSHWDNDPIYIRDKHGDILMWDFFGGNLLGVMKKLPYLSKLGVNIIYFNPIFEAKSNHKYDTGDYHKIDNMFGDESIFRKLCEEAHRLGIDIILDGVFSHTGSDSIYFNKEGNYPSLGAFQSKESKYYPWYHFEQFPDAYESWWGVKDLPNVDECHPDYLDFIIYHPDSVLNHWQQCGIKGWRLDVADELPDTFIKAFKKQSRQNDPESVLIGEVWEDASNKISYGKRKEYLLGEELDSVTNYIFRQVVIDFMLGHIRAEQVHHKLMSVYENYPRPHFNSLLNVIGSHDTPRILSVLRGEGETEEGKGLAIKRLKLVVLWQLLFPGVPCIYYGDEAGLTGEHEPLNRRPYPWGNENKEILTWYKRIIKIRNKDELFQRGQFQSFWFGDDVYGFIRKSHDRQAIILINRGTVNKQIIKLDSDWNQHLNHYRKILAAEASVYVKEDILHVELNPLGYCFLINKEKGER